MQQSHKKSLGLCIGAATVKVVELHCEGASVDIAKTGIYEHDCDPRSCLSRLLEEYHAESLDYCCITGRKFKNFLDLPSITEPEACEYALQFVRDNYNQSCDILLSLGAENFIRYDISDKATIASVQSSSKCASGTGAFFIQQLRRMDLSLDDASALSLETKAYQVSGRCSVFCKSDCTHALNKGIPKDQVLAGLGLMIAEKAVELLGIRTDGRIAAVGGVTRNNYVTSAIRAQLESFSVLEHADVFEALGAAVAAIQQELSFTAPLCILPRGSSYSILKPLREAEPLVTFCNEQKAVASRSKRCIIGLDVGSTTTKAVAMRIEDQSVISSVYLRTNGDPIGASRRCYQRLREDIADAAIEIEGLGVTGSGRYIAGLHAQTDAVINEIIAHATAASFYDSEVDTILEIGGQDAKYTYLVNGVPCDYAMNEACSAGTGSFIEESVREAFNIACEDIESMALQSDSPPNFNDQCAAFISSDIKNAGHELGREDIIAGLVYSICKNYNNRVKGPRKVGNRVFMQGGVCYNKAVPLAMASLIGKPIIVPPEPGLMGAFGVALETQQRINLGLLLPQRFHLEELEQRKVSYGKSFVCTGSSADCDLGCTISLIEINGKKYPYGGMCSKYEGRKLGEKRKPAGVDLVKKRQDAVFSTLEQDPISPARPESQLRIGLSRAFLTNLLFPLFNTFFTELGHKIVLSEAIDRKGFRRTFSSFCYPAQIAHGMLGDLIKAEPDLIFMPQIYELSVERSVSREPAHQSTCITVQSEPFYLKSAFKEAAHLIESPLLDFSQGWEHGGPALKDFACERLGASRQDATNAFEKALWEFRRFLAARKDLGFEALSMLAKYPAQTAVVVFGRPYNAFAAEANMGIPRKFTSRGIATIPFDCLPFHDEPCTENMTWAMGQDLIRAAHFVKKHPQLFGCFITNFSCGPDSFLVGYFRDIMGIKPSLTLEIDNHTADAGVTTRVEAFLDIIERYQKLGLSDPQIPQFRRAVVQQHNGRFTIIDSSGKERGLRDPNVTLLLPSMGKLLSGAAAATLKGSGLNARAVEVPSFETLMCGRGHSSCKECLPLILTAGSLVESVKARPNEDEMLLYFMPTTNGTCRFPQYYVFLNKLIEKRQIPNAATLTLTSENSYGGLGILTVLKLLKAVIVSDVMEDIKNALRVLAVDRDLALEQFEVEWEELLSCFAGGSKDLYPKLRRAAIRLSRIPLKASLGDAKIVLVAGEIYVRKDEFSSQAVIDMLAERDIIALRAPMFEWIDYIDYWVQHIEQRKLTLAEAFELKTRLMVQRRVEKKIKSIMTQSGLYQYHLSDIDSMIRFGEHFVDRSFGGETILVIGSFFRDIMKHYHGVVSVGPFACLPTRIVEAILTPESAVKDNDRVLSIPGMERIQGMSNLPFLSVESDGNPFPQVIEARLEAFSLQVERAAERMAGAKISRKKNVKLQLIRNL